MDKGNSVKDELNNGGCISDIIKQLFIENIELREEIYKHVNETQLLKREIKRLMTINANQATKLKRLQKKNHKNKTVKMFIDENI